MARPVKERTLLESNTMKSQESTQSKRQRRLDRNKEEQNRQRSIGGGNTNELGITQGQNGEQGNTVHPRDAKLSGGESAH